jgi:hypothetical protein
VAKIQMRQIPPNQDDLVHHKNFERGHNIGCNIFALRKKENKNDFLFATTAVVRLNE